MPDCSEEWEEVNRQSALVDAAGIAYEQAATLLMFHTQNLVDAIEAAMACETGQNLQAPAETQLQSMAKAAASLHQAMRAMTKQGKANK